MLWLPLACPPMRTYSATQAHALTGIWTSDPFVCRWALNPLGYASHGQNVLTLNYKSWYGDLEQLILNFPHVVLAHLLIITGSDDLSDYWVALWCMGVQKHFCLSDLNFIYNSQTWENDLSKSYALCFKIKTVFK